MFPKQAKNIPNHRKAVAPYNFVELPEKIVPAQLPLPTHDQYHRGCYTGRIKCQLTTESPLYIRCGFTPADYAEFGEKPYEQQTEEQRIRRAAFFNNPANSKPTIPGSSLRGMLRSLIEIISFSKIDRVSAQSKFFFRAVAADKDDPLKAQYNKHIPKKVKAGYLEQEGGEWFIYPASTVDGSSFIWVKEAEICRAVPSLIPLEDDRYLPQYIPISFEGTFVKNYRRFAKKVSGNVNRYQQRGTLVTSGNMRQEGATSEPNRKYHCIVPSLDSEATRIKIDADAIRAYREALTDFQKQAPFDEKMGALIAGRPIFYCAPEPNCHITRFGHNPNFRIAYTLQDQVSSIIDFLPETLREADAIDLADAIFGFVRSTKREGAQQARSGRVFVEDAVCRKSWEEARFEDSPLIPKILSSPKPTTFQHYLVQKDKLANKKDLQHYASQPNKDTVIRGHKLYWHHGSNPTIELADHETVSDTQKTKIHPIASTQVFDFDIHFENLSAVELGAILWILDIAQDEKYRLSLGMGKPLGMGAVKLAHEVVFSDRPARYEKLFDGQDWQVGEKTDSQQGAQCVAQFERYILDQIGETDHPETGKAEFLKDVPRIKMLLLLLSWSKLPDKEQTRYLTIEPNEYKERKVLPTPFQVMGESDRDERRLNDGGGLPSPALKKSQSTPVQRFEIGQILDATIESKNGVKVTYRMANGEKRTNSEHRRHQELQIGASVEVEVVSLKDDGMFNKIKLHQE
ncbi:TIGR03986 family CRISPR-associated RAMP protein [Cyanobacteria bacterium FACHB-63]|nr:TIGR03986 family CRISPR-associated RAMP protein [Cyanobacteria bacterium FACHB-63]